jgi:hypothetical protein
MRTTKFSARLTSVIGYAHLVYLGLLPALATFGVLYTYGYPDSLFLFLLIGGAAAVGVYVAVLFYYTPLPASPGRGILFLLDGPAWALLSLSSRRVFLLGFAVEAFIVDGTAVCLSILIIVFGKAGARAAAGWMLLALAATLSLVWPYFRDELWGRWASMGWLAAGIVEAVAAHLKQLERDEAARSPNAAAVFIVILILTWAGALILGNVLHELAS